jgi:hypothetical protein
MRTWLSLSSILVLILFFGACGRGSQQNASNTESSAAPASSTPKTSPLTGFAKDLQYVRDGQFTYIWVFSRQDGKPLDRDDGNFLKTNAPQVVDWVITEEGRKVIAGTNFNLEEGNLATIKKKYVVEDYSGK